MNDKSDRAWPLPRTPWVMRMRWSELLFAHWAIDPDTVRQRLPAGVQLDTRNDRAWIGVVPFLMTGIAPRFCPPLPGLSRFLELNVRTYVVVDGKPGVWFFSLDAESRVAVRVARATFNLPYMDAAMSIDRDDDGTVHYQSRRTHRGEPAANYDVRYAATGPYARAKSGTLEHWLTARYCLYSADRRGRIYRGEINHPPWQLAPATYQQTTNTMAEGLNFPLDGDVHVRMAQPVDVTAWYVSRCR